MITTNKGALREEITRVGRSLYARGYTAGTAGNISARLPDDWPITPTDTCLDTLDPARTTRVPATDEWVSGDKPSEALALYRGTYGRSAEAHAMVHTYSTHLVALTLTGVWRETGVLPPIALYCVMKVGHVPLIAYRRPGHPDVAARIAALANGVYAVLLDRLGPVVRHGSVSTTAYALEELEGIAQLWLMTEPRPAPLSDTQIDELRRTFGARW